MKKVYIGDLTEKELRQALYAVESTCLRGGYCEQCMSGPYAPGAIEDLLSNAAGGRPWRECFCGLEEDRLPYREIYKLIESALKSCKERINKMEPKVGYQTVPIEEWFSVTNPQHLSALSHFMKNGCWPQFFIPADVKWSADSERMLLRKIAEEWIRKYTTLTRETSRNA